MNFLQAFAPRAKYREWRAAMPPVEMPLRRAAAHMLRFIVMHRNGQSNSEDRRTRNLPLGSFIHSLSKRPSRSSLDPARNANVSTRQCFWIPAHSAPSIHRFIAPVKPRCGMLQ